MTGPLVVTGGTGLLGSAIRQAFPQAVFLSSTDGDLRDIGVAYRIFTELRPSKVVHLAARVGGVKENATHNVAFFEDNALINAAVLSAARRARVPKLISLLSSCAFPLFAERSTKENDLHSSAPCQGNEGYGYAKRMLDVHTCLVAREEGLDWSTLTPVTMYGPHDSFDAESGHVVGSLIRRCWEAKSYGVPFNVWGSGQAVRQFVFVRDVAQVILERLERVHGSSATIIIAPDDGRTIKSLAEFIARTMNYTGPIQFDPRQPEGVLVKRVCSTEFSAQFPNFRFTPLHTGLSETVQWFVSHCEPSLCRSA